MAARCRKSFLMEVFEINEQTRGSEGGHCDSQEQIAALRREIEERAARFESQI